MKQEPASKNKDGTIIQFPSFENRKKTKGLILFPVLSGILCAAVFGLILNILLETPDQQPLLAEPPEETSLFESEAFSFWVLQAGAFSSEEAAKSFISGMTAEVPHVLIKQDDMVLLWIGAAGTEDMAKSLAARQSGDVYVKQVSVNSFQLDVTEPDKEWLTATMSAINQKLAAPDTKFMHAPGDKLENNSLQNFHQSIKSDESETAFLQSLSAILQLEGEVQD
ncbi:SPOR domain-containing protein [Jeotgalibacillus malaysiensis]|uniref:SPOR domain-containing protein n=1 Tax=Jeotgalibacillus malaysiensis TaxID=1508404 RepID=UPI0038507E74